MWSKRLPHEEARKTAVWGSQDGTDTPLYKLTVDHLVNILNWVAERPHYSEDVRSLLKAEAEYRKLINFAKGFAYPYHNGEKWVLTKGIK